MLIISEKLCKVYPHKACQTKIDPAAACRGVMQSCVCWFFRKTASIFCAVNIESEEQRSVVIVIALQMTAGKSAAIDDMVQADDSAELRFEIDLVAFICDKINV